MTRDETTTEDGRMRIRNSRMGEFEADESDIIRLSGGLIGYEEHQEFYLLEPDSTRPYGLLIARRDPEIAFALADPGLFSDGPYILHVGEPDREALDLLEEDVVEVHVILAGDSSGRLTANLRGPVVVNLRNRRARQLILYAARLSVRQPLGSSWAGATRAGNRTQVRFVSRRAA